MDLLRWPLSPWLNHGPSPYPEVCSASVESAATASGYIELHPWWRPTREALRSTVQGSSLEVLFDSGWWLLHVIAIIFGGGGFQIFYWSCGYNNYWFCNNRCFYNKCWFYNYCSLSVTYTNHPTEGARLWLSNWGLSLKKWPLLWRISPSSLACVSHNALSCISSPEPD